MAVNGKGVWLGCKYAAIQMLKQSPFGGDPGGDCGWIINMCSIMGLVGDVGVTCYAASKDAVMQMTKAAALDLAKERIHVNAIAPGFVDTNMLAPIKAKHGTESATQMLCGYHPWGRMGSAQDIAKMAVFLAGDGASSQGRPLLWMEDIRRDSSRRMWPVEECNSILMVLDSIRANPLCK